MCSRMFLECFLGFLGTVQLSASKAWILGTVQHFLHADAQNAVLSLKNQKKCCTVPKKPKIPCQKGLCAQDCFWNGFLGFFRDSTALSASKAWILGTVLG